MSFKDPLACFLSNHKPPFNSRHNNMFDDDGEVVSITDLVDAMNFIVSADLQNKLDCALEYIAQSPCDPDIHLEQLEAYNALVATGAMQEYVKRKNKE